MALIDENGDVDMQECIRLLTDEFDADIWFYSGPINDFGLGEVISNFKEDNKKDKIVLILVTNGGSANAAFQIASLFQKNYKKFYLFIPSYCKSAGTLIACGAHKLFMDVFSELGPLDVQLAKPNEIAVDKSGLLSRSTFDALTEVCFEMFSDFLMKITLSSNGQINFKIAAEISSKMTTDLMAGIFSQINPDTIGSDYRDLNVALQYGIRLATRAENCDISTIMKLVKNYPSHDFIIDAEEASDLFRSVEEPHELLYVLAGALGAAAYNEASRPIVANFTDEDDGGEQDEDATEEGGAGHEMAEGEEANRSSDTGALRRDASDDDGDTDPKAKGKTHC